MLKRTGIRNIPGILYRHKDSLWFVIWISGLLMLLIWDILFLNRPALRQIAQGFFNTVMIALLVIAISLLMAWIITLLLYISEQKRAPVVYLILTFILNLIRSIPQIIGILIGFMIITGLIYEKILSGSFSIILSIAFTIALFVFQELVDLMRERIAFFKKSDFFNAMRVCGIHEQRIINRDILLKSSRIHIFNKIISLFGMTIFLLCSIDFILSVGLSTDVSAVNLPVTLGSLLSKIDSKQDILAIGITLTDPSYAGALFFDHLQGITVAFLIVFSLLCIYKIANGFARRFHL